MDGAFITKDKPVVMAFEFFDEPLVSKTLEGNRANKILTILAAEAYNHVKPLYVITQFYSQLVFRVLIDIGATLNILPMSML